MVAVHIFIEGIATNDSSEVNTIDRSVEFRRAFHKLLSQSIENERIELSIEPATGWKAAAKTYIRHKQKGDKNYCLLIDLDGNIKHKSTRLKEELVGISQKLADFPNEVFFMVQEMEAWVLSQPDIIETYADNKGYRRKLLIGVGAHHFLRAHPIEISKPSEKLKTIFREYFEEQVERKGRIKIKAVEYHKTKIAPDLIKILDFQKLTETFEDAKNLQNLMKAIDIEIKKN
jgi:hypothetical protein